jgi:tetratricopeptide (TPR) repeat protein
MSYDPLQLAEAFIKAGELTDALETLDARLIDAPDDERALRLRAQINARQVDEVHWRKALTDLSALPLMTPEDYILKIALLEKLHDFTASIHTAQTAYETFPDHERLAERLLQSLRDARQFDQAREIAEARLAQQPESWRWLQWAGDLARDAGEHLTAITRYTDALRAIESNHQNLSANSAIAGIYSRILLSRAEAYLQSNQLDEAETDYGTASQFIADDPVIPFNQGLIMALRGDLDQASAMCRSAFAKMPPALINYTLDDLRNNPNFHDLYHQLKDYSQYTS